MKRIIEGVRRAYLSGPEELTYGVFYPVALVILIGFAGWLFS